MNYLSDESNKRLKMGAFASDKENMERNILVCLLRAYLNTSSITLAAYIVPVVVWVLYNI